MIATSLGRRDSVLVRTLQEEGRTMATKSSASTSTPPPRKARDLISRRFRDLLHRDASPLLDDENVVRQLLAQLNGILDDTFAALRLLPKPDGAPSALDLSTRIGEARAVSGIHPSQSLHTAALLFEAALPVVVDMVLDSGQKRSVVEPGVALNRAIMERMAVAAESYVGFLLDRINNSNRDERRRISRELHDVVAPSIVLSLQNLQLHEAYRDDAPAQADDKLRAARRALSDAISSVRALAAETRESLSRNGLEYAISHVLTRKPAGTGTTLNVSGRVESLPAAYREEIFLIVQEAIRNAFTHAQPTKVLVHLDVGAYEVTAHVRDNGRGFNPSTARTDEGGLGITSMTERATLLGGTVAVTSGVGDGTTVNLRVPIPPHASQP